MRRNTLLLISVLTAASALSCPAQKKKTAPAAKPVPAPPRHAAAVLPPLTGEERAIQMLNRFTFGQRPGDVEAVMKMGPDAWFEQQLNPDKIPDPVLDKRLADFPSLYLPPSQALVEYPTGGVIRQVADGKRPYPPDPVLAGAYEALVAVSDHRKMEQAQQGNQPDMTPEMAEAQKFAQRKQQQVSAAVLADEVLAFPKTERIQAIMKMPVEQRITLVGFVPDPQRTLLFNDFSPRDREFFNLMGGKQVIDDELQQAKVLRAILSERQLLEVMTDFWYNHFNVDLTKGPDRWYTPTYERDAIRAYALGRFRDLLLATAQHPAMLYYLDNWSSIGPDSMAAGKPNQKKQDRGLNENYGREVMELHTVGVNGGYSQADVTNLAKILTGWTIDQPEQGGGFVFDPRKHEPGSKQWFGQKVSEDGYVEGQRALEWLAAQPQTAHFISYKLAQRFVADDPPDELVDRMAQTYLSTGGDIKEVLRAMVRSPEFNSQKYYRVKVKTPLEFVASVFRATDTNPANPGALVSVIGRMGEPLYQMQPPTGYSTTADRWMNSVALVDRLNFSLQFASSKVGGIKFDAPRLLAEGLLARTATPAAPLPASVPASLPGSVPASPRGGSRAEAIALSSASVSGSLPSGQEEALGLMEQMLVDGKLSPRVSDVIHKELAGAQPSNDPAQTLDTITALILGSPEFQMH
jgi:uncharacterized protein (DUF1800 family)